jgi:hypothetical protein
MNDDDIFAELTKSEDMEEFAQTAEAKAYVQGQMAYIAYGIRIDVLTDILHMNQAERLAQFIRIGKNVVNMSTEACMMWGYDPDAEEFLSE